MRSGSEPLLSVRGLFVSYGAKTGVVDAVRGVDLTLRRGSVLALVGESGSGKSTIAQAVAGLLPPSAHVRHDGVHLDGVPVTTTARGARGLRGSRIGYVPQDPGVSLDPVWTIGRQVTEVFAAHATGTKAERKQWALDALRRAGLPSPEEIWDSYPHELSGGMCQRVLIAIALALDPTVAIADEPTTALDVTVQRRILDLVVGQTRARGTGLLLITHDLMLAGEYADDIVVLCGGRVVERGTAAEVIGSPQEAYTRTLIESVPRPRWELGRDGGGGRAGALVLSARHVTKTFGRRGGRHQRVVALDDVSLDIEAGTAVGLVGESGSGKSTLARTLLLLEKPDTGTVTVEGRDAATLTAGEVRGMRRRLQYVYQNPFAALDPRFTVGQAVSEPLDVFALGSRADRRRRVAEVLDQVRLPESFALRRPGELSGGQRQRVAIARALILEPSILICDEPVSALDVTVQAQVLDILDELHERLSLTMLFISHDLAVVQRLCTQVAVLRQGRIVDLGQTQDVLDNPQQEYTRELVAAAPGRALARR